MRLQKILLRAWLGAICSLNCAASAMAQVSEVHHRACRPGETTLIQLTGKELNSGLRVTSSRPDCTVSVQSVTAESATVAITLPEASRLGSLALFAATSHGPAEPWMMLVDDLPLVASVSDHDSREHAQDIPALCAVSDVCRHSQGCFYRISVASGQRIAIEVLTQTLGSPMDPVLRLLDSAGKPVLEVDDDATGPEARLSYQFSQAGQFTIHVRDSRFATGGRFHLRVGDFPLLSHAQPLAVRRGESTQVQFVTLDGSIAEPHWVALPASHTQTRHDVATRSPGGQSSAWTSVQAVDAAVLSASDLSSDAVVVAPVSISGRLAETGASQRIGLQGVPGKTIHVHSYTRSLGCPTLLKMQLLNAAGQTVVETAVANDDEWHLAYQFADDGRYTLQLQDLLGRGGASFSYLVNILPHDGYTLAFKGDAKTPLQFALPVQRGAMALELLVQRLGYDGPICLELVGPPAGITILNPVIPAGATESRIYLTAGPEWQAEQLQPVRLLGRAMLSAQVATEVSNLSMLRARQPHVLYPSHDIQGQLLLAGTDKSSPVVGLNATHPIQLARPLKQFTFELTLQRLSEDFKGAVTLLPNRLPGGWSGTFNIEGEKVTASLSRESSDSVEPNELIVLVFGEHQGRGFIETIALPVTWFDPVHIDVTGPRSIVAGSTAILNINVKRHAPAQEIQLEFNDLPVGVTPLQQLTLSADQTQATVQVPIPADMPAGDFKLGFTAHAHYGGDSISLSGRSSCTRVVPKPARVEVYPDPLILDHSQATRQLVITAFDAADKPYDWTAFAEIVSANSLIAEVRSSRIFSVADGQTEIKVIAGGIEHSVAVIVSNQQIAGPVRFESEVLAALSKQGCNSGACHGSPSGKGMFRLSLRAFDRELDELTLIREEYGRRVNSVEPEQSLLLLKPLMKVSHGGGRQLRTDDPAYRVLRNWIEQGGRPDPPDTPRCVRLEVFPNSKRILAETDGRQQLSVTAHFADGSQRDVTDLAAYQSSSESIAAVDTAGVIRAHGRGEAVILVRFLEHIESLPLLVIDSDSEFQWTPLPPSNYIDQLVYDKLQQMQIRPSETCSDSEFIRRVYLDLIGLLPEVDQTRDFLEDERSDKRQRLVDQLLQRDEYARFWALKWGDLLKLTSKALGADGAYKYSRWLERAIREDMPYDQFARQLITASGSTLANPPANFYRAAADASECVETVSQVFLGARLQCAKCHNHPFERWTQDNYYGLAAFFNRVQRRSTQRPGEMFIWSDSTGEVIQPRTGQTMQPWLPGHGLDNQSPAQDRRVMLADWLTSASNPFFAYVGANRLWSHMFARGLTEPVDDFRASNPATNQPLLESLAQDFRDHGYSAKHVLRTIANSQTYQASSQTNTSNHGDINYFSHQVPRLLKAEPLLDAINHVTGVHQTFGSLPAGTRATQLPAPDLVPVDFLKVFGQPERSTVCACERGSDSNLAMAIELFNGPLIHQRLQDSGNRFRKLLAAGSSVDQILDELYLAALCRTASPSERTASHQHIQTRNDTAAGLEDVCWALLNTDEFLFQH
ncbi:MAG: DUF1549 domain-containing protein [Pirellulaceae bacterium]|nr:DUF1549 domain-containing protein [Pirellulaceae bacterium]